MKTFDLTVVMYHYVRDLKFSRYPEIKGLDFNLFKEQILYLQKHYNFVTIEQVIAAYNENEKLTKKAVLLTFDDGYAEHFTHVFPFLNSLKIQGCFYPPVKAITEHTVLDVNKIHFILAAGVDVNVILEAIKVLLESNRQEFNLKSFEYYYNKLAIPNRFDSKDVIFIKRLLQVELEESLRAKITSILFSQIVGVEESIFSRELYMTKEQISCMAANGMHIGSHGYDHYWLGYLNKEQQRVEIEKSMEFISDIGGNLDKWTICYPYGNFNDTTIELLNEYKCSLGFSTVVDLVSIYGETESRFKIPRLDTNDLPKKSTVEPDAWFLKAN